MCGSPELCDVYSAWIHRDFTGTNFFLVVLEAKLPGSAADVPKSYVQSLGMDIAQLKAGLQLRFQTFLTLKSGRWLHVLRVLEW